MIEMFDLRGRAEIRERIASESLPKIRPNSVRLQDMWLESL